MAWLTALGIAIWTIALAAQGLGTLLGRHRLNRKRAPSGPFDQPPVTILKPLKGVDQGLLRNLESFFRLDYSEYEVIFSVAALDDPALEIVRKLIRRHPNVDAKIVVSMGEIGLNPKVNNLATGYRRAKHDLVLISDSNTRVEPGFLRAIARELGPEIGVVCAPVAGRDPRAFGAFLECLNLNSFVARGTFLTDALGAACVTGKAMLFRRADLERLGGLAAFANYLAEDFMIGRRMSELGLKVRFCNTPVRQVVGRFTLKDFVSRQIRWGRIRKTHGKAVFWVEPLLGCLGSGVIGALSFSAAFGVAPSAFMGLHLTFWAICDYLMVRRLQGKLEPTVPVAWVTRELLSLLLWVAIASGNTVRWRGRTLTLRPDGLIQGAEGHGTHEQLISQNAGSEPGDSGEWQEAAVSVGRRYK